MKREHLKKELDNRSVPSSLHEGLIEYILSGRPTGGFLRAILENNLFAAVKAADSDNIDRIPDIVLFLYHEAPSDCLGSYDNVQRWISFRGLEGLKSSISQRLEQLKA